MREEKERAREKKTVLASPRFCSMPPKETTQYNFFIYFFRGYRLRGNKHFVHSCFKTVPSREREREREGEREREKQTTKIERKKKRKQRS